MNTKKIEIFTVPGRSNEKCATISGAKYMNLGYYDGGGSFFTEYEGGNFLSPAGGIGNNAGLLDVFIMSPEIISGASYGDCCDCVNSDGGDSGGDNGSNGGTPDPCAGVDCTQWGGGNTTPSRAFEFNDISLTSQLMSSGAAAECCDPGGGGGLGGGSLGDVHYFTSTYGAAGKHALVFRDENLYETIGKSHWVIEWLEISKDNEVSAILSRRSSSNYFENTSINSKFYIYGNPVGVAKQIKDDSKYVMKGISMTTQNPKITGSTSLSAPEIKYMGGMFVEFFRQIVRENGPFGPRASVIGRNNSFVTGDLFRLVSGDVDLSPVTTNGQNEVIVNQTSLRSALSSYVDKLTGNMELLNKMGDVSPFLTDEQIRSDSLLVSGLRSAGAAPEDKELPSYYPQLMSTSQSVSIINRYNQMATPFSFFKDPLMQLNEDGDLVPLVPSKTISSTWADTRSQTIRNKLQPKTFNCAPCVAADFFPKGGDCSEEAGKFKAAFKIESENVPGGIQVGPVNDCRCCGPLAEDYYWNDAAFCGRSESLCLPLAVISNGKPTGYSNYGFEHRVVPFFANKNDNMGAIDKDIKLYEFPYVLNGKLVIGKFHCLNRLYDPNSNKFYSAKEFEPFIIDFNGQSSGIKIMCNNSFRQDYSGLPFQDLVYY